MLNKNTTSLLFTLSVLLLPFHCWALSCTLIKSGQTIDTSTTAKIYVDISPEEEQSKAKLIDLSNEISCQNNGGTTGNHQYLYVTSGSLLATPSLFRNVQAWISINNVEYSLHPAFVGGRTLVLDLYSPDGKPGAYTPVPIKITYQLSDTPGNAQAIRKGDELISLILTATNSGSIIPMTIGWDIYANNDAMVVTSDCTINHGDVLNVSFGTIDAADIKTTTAEEGVSMTEPLDFECTNATVNQNVNIKLIGSSASFSNGEYLATSNNALGVAMVHNGEVVMPGQGLISRMSNGTGNDNVKFIVVRDPAIFAKDVPTGEFTASATFIMTAD